MSECVARVKLSVEFLLTPLQQVLLANTHTSLLGGVVLKKKKVIELVPFINSTLKSYGIGPLGQGPLHRQYPKKSEVRESVH